MTRQNISENIMKSEKKIFGVKSKELDPETVKTIIKRHRRIKT